MAIQLLDVYDQYHRQEKLKWGRQAKYAWDTGWFSWTLKLWLDEMMTDEGKWLTEKQGKDRYSDIQLDT